MKKIFVIFFIFISTLSAADYLIPLDKFIENPNIIHEVINEIESNKKSKYYSQEIAKQDIKLTILLSKKYNISLSNQNKLKRKISEIVTEEEMLELLIKNIDQNGEYLNVTQYLKDSFELIFIKEGFDE